MKISSLVPDSFVALPTDRFRPGTVVNKLKCRFILGNGGTGDLICYLQPLKWVEVTWKHVEKTVYTFPYFVHVAKAFLDDTWTFLETKDNGEVQVPDADKYPILIPDVRGRINLAGKHALDFGFDWFSNGATPEDWNFYPRLKDFKMGGLVNKALGIGKYAVMTPGAKFGVRQMLPEQYNAIVSHLKSKGVTPVHIGKSEANTVFDSKYDYSGLDLRDQTSILEAMLVMDKAEVVVGLDNGMLHVAGCTDTPIVFGYTVALPVHRRPRRPSGNVFDVEPDRKDVPCYGCQSNARYIMKDLQGVCLYAGTEWDKACITHLTVEKWTNAIDLALKVRSGQ